MSYAPKLFKRWTQLLVVAACLLASSAQANSIHLFTDEDDKSVLNGVLFHADDNTITRFSGYIEDGVLYALGLAAKSADDGSGNKSADDGSGAKSADDGSGGKSADDGSGDKSADDGSGAALPLMTLDLSCANKGLKTALVESEMKVSAIDLEAIYMNNKPTTCLAP